MSGWGSGGGPDYGGSGLAYPGRSWRRELVWWRRTPTETLRARRNALRRVCEEIAAHISELRPVGAPRRMAWIADYCDEESRPSLWMALKHLEMERCKLLEELGEILTRFDIPVTSEVNEQMLGVSTINEQRMKTLEIHTVGVGVQQVISTVG